MEHEGARVLITGGTSGIGAAIAAAYAADGASVTITGTRGGPADYDEDLSAYRYLQLASMEDAAAIDTVAATVGEVDILINNAGMSMMAVGLDEWEPDVFARAVNMHLVGAYRLSHALKDRLGASKRRGGGVITGIGSMSSLFGIEAVPGYGAGKTGLLGLTRAMAVAWGRHNIRANVLALGMIETRMTKPALDYPGFAEPFVARTPLGRIGQAEDCAGPALFLSSAAASFITGQTLAVDGGFSIQG
ncbi:SDR family NAD(P)-dependent oxidoreductase [Sphingomonas montanisoli]|uniref:SDR family oxidoreductase n=1 Tax=Sphingomonas montanisoli TaxID=2606412 RepID=A0A5D9CHI5_9SPHN|nr:SDR family oxidoreductase [Sphingomonas montanisoli]TZG29581.1 SDR family oxidoreductase [Sphingomonas montanisoli]